MFDERHFKNHKDFKVELKEFIQTNSPSHSEEHRGRDETPWNMAPAGGCCQLLPAAVGEDLEVCLWIWEEKDEKRKRVNGLKKSF